MVVPNRNAPPEEKANLSADRTDHPTLFFVHCCTLQSQDGSTDLNNLTMDVTDHPYSGT